MHSVLLCLQFLISPRFYNIDHHKHLFSRSLRHPCWGKNPGTFRMALASCCSGHSGFLISLSGSISDSSSTAQSSSLSFGLSKSPFQLSQSSVSEMLSGAPSSSLVTGWRLIILIQRTFNIRVHPPGRSFAGTTSCWKSVQDAFTISPMSEMCPTAVICLFSMGDSFCVAHRFWLPCHISKMSWTMAILCNVLSSSSFIISESCSLFVISDTGLLPAKSPLLAWANCLTKTI